MQLIAETLSNIYLGEPSGYLNLTVFPLLSSTAPDPAYLTLDEALEQGLAQITEVSEGGSVPELAFENDAGRRVLLVDGQELVGARQNRVLNLSILVAPKSKVVIPVSCVEHGRWRYVSPRFASAKRNLYPKARAEKMSQVSHSLRRAGSRLSDQARIWDSIADKSARMASHSETGAMSDIYAQQEERLRTYTGAFTPQDSQVGAVFSINGKVVGADLFDAPATFRKLMAQLVESYALDAIEEHTEPAPGTSAQAVRQFIADLKAASTEHFSPVGEGEDIRLTGEALAGGALVVDGRVVHLAAFRVEPAVTSEE